MMMIYNDFEKSSQLETRSGSLKKKRLRFAIIIVIGELRKSKSFPFFFSFGQGFLHFSLPPLNKP